MTVGEKNQGIVILKQWKVLKGSFFELGTNIAALKNYMFFFTKTNPAEWLWTSAAELHELPFLTSFCFSCVIFFEPCFKQQPKKRNRFLLWFPQLWAIHYRPFSRIHSLQLWEFSNPRGAVLGGSSHDGGEWLITMV